MFDAALLPGVLAAAPDAIVVVDAEGRVRYANNQLTVLFGYDTDDVVGQQVEMLLPERLRQRHAGHRQDFHHALRVRPMGVGQELLARRRDGSEFPVEISLSPVGDGEQNYVAAVIRDATERRAAERELRQARAGADRANQAKSRFLATASHDLRQPLQTLALLNGTLRRSVKDEDMRDAVEQQGQAIGAMSRLLNALLDISKLESGSMQVEITDFDVGAALEELRDDFRLLAADKGLRLELAGSRTRAHTDRTLFMQVLRNLVANAIKYTDHGSVWVRYRAASDKVIVEVVDTGIGISHEHLGCIFDEFFQAGTASHSARQGYGLGLSIVQRIVNFLGLHIEVESEPGRGSTFRLELPAGASAAAEAGDAAAGKPPPQARGPDGGFILLVEDDAAVRKAMQVFLKSEGYRVAAAASLPEALRLCDQMPGIDLVISDYHLAEARGTEVIAALRSRLGGHLASILVTGDTSSAIQELPRDNQLRIISKPVDAEELLDLIRILMPPHDVNYVET
jgi:two-component system, sensor histidine kinase